MSQYYSEEDYEEMVKLYKKNKKNAAAASREFATLHPDYTFLPKGKVIRRAVERKFRTRQAAPQQKMWVYVGDLPKQPSRSRKHMSDRLYNEIMGIKPPTAKKKATKAQKKTETAKKSVPAQANNAAQSTSQPPKKAKK